MSKRMLIFFCTTVMVSLVLCGCNRAALQTGEERMPGGDASRGRVLLEEYGCQSCHAIPGVSGQPSYVGPPLTAWAERQYIVGMYPNTSENLALWIRFPQDVEPGTAMPNLGVDEQDALDMGAYLYSLN